MTEIFNRSPIKESRQDLRNRLTSAEVILWRYLRKRKLKGYKFRRQYSINTYIVDFYCPKIKLVIEIDGGYHLKPDVQEYDKERQKDIEYLGIKFLRFTNEEVYHKLDDVLAQIMECLV